MPSTSTDVAGYVLSIGMSSGNYQGGTEVNIPVSSASAGAGGSLTYTIQLDRSRDNYLVMRAYDTSMNFSPFSNEIRVAMITASAAAPTGSVTVVGTGTTSGTSSMLASPMTGFAASAAAAAPSGSSQTSDPNASQTAQGGAAPVSLDLDGATEYLASTLAAPIATDAGLTVSLWAKAPLVGDGRRGLFRLESAADTSLAGVEISLVNGASAPALELRVFDSAQALEQIVLAPAPLTSNDWWHVALAVDATGTARLYVDGALALERSDLALPATFAALAAQGDLLVVGAGDAPRSVPWLGRLGDTAVWSATLRQEEIGEISLYGHELDLRANGAAYASANALVHYWRLGADAAAVGLDSGLAPINLDDPNGNLGADDVVNDAPASLAGTASAAQ